MGFTDLVLIGGLALLAVVVVAGIQAVRLLSAD